MLLPLHIIIALSSVGYTTYLLFAPSSTKLKVAYILVALTLISGTYLGITKPAHLVQTCVTGLVYIGLVTSGIVFARHKLFNSASS